MVTNYEQLTAEERTTIMVMAQEGKSLWAMARILPRAPSTISREWRRHEVPDDALGTRGYDAKRAGQEARRQRFKPRRARKLAVNTVLFGVVEHVLREGWSPGQIAGTLHMLWPDAPERRVAAETIDTCRYALPRGALRQELIACLRKARTGRLPRARGTDRRGQLRDGCDFNRCCIWYSIPPHSFRTKTLNPIFSATSACRGNPPSPAVHPGDPRPPTPGAHPRPRPAGQCPPPVTPRPSTAGTAVSSRPVHRVAGHEPLACPSRRW